jgi:L-ascorbate metabolism protein UlaG (beta-lactamase superfamily)
MLRLLSVLIAGPLFIGAVAADSSAPVKIRWHGQSFFDIESSKGTRIAIDPHAIEAYGRQQVSADLVLISHEHNDHNQLAPIRNADRAKVLHGLRAIGNRLDWNPINETFRDVHVRTVGVYHDAMEGMERGKNAVFIIDVDGLHIVHLGDLGHMLTPRQAKQIGPVDVLIIPVGGIYTLNGEEAKQVVAQLKPRQYILPMHYGTKVFSDVLPADEFLEDQKSESVKRFLSNSLTDEADFKPAEPIIALLNWR